ncbi:MAG: hypothetical protein EG828_01195 [Deltaproteobacteria bacterium]|nr:hypothetical protein [Deltaproteobacteria bacterium]
MKKRKVWMIALLLAPGAVAYASPVYANAGVAINLPGFGLSVNPAGVGLNIGLPWVVAPAPAYAYPDTSYAAPYETVVAGAAPVFVLPPELGFYVAVGVPYDLFFYNNSYYIYRGNNWYNSSYYNGPWTQMYHSNIPYLFNRYPFERVRHYRDSYYGRYQRYGAWDGYKHFRPGHRGEYRGEYGRDRRDYARPHSPDYSTGNRPDVRRTNSNWQGRNSGYTSTRPAVSDRNYRDNSAYTRSPYNRPVNSASPAYNRMNSTGQRYYGDRPAQIRPSRVAPDAGNRAVYTRQNRSGPPSGNNSSYTRQYATGQGNYGKASYTQAKYGRQTPVGKPVYTRMNSSDQRREARNFNHTSNRPGSANRGWQGDRR